MPGGRGNSGWWGKGIWIGYGFFIGRSWASINLNNYKYYNRFWTLLSSVMLIIADECGSTRDANSGATCLKERKHILKLSYCFGSLFADLISCSQAKNPLYWFCELTTCGFPLRSSHIAQFLQVRACRVTWYSCDSVVKNGFFRFGALFTYDGLTRPDCWCISNIGIQFPTVHLWDLFLSSVFAFTTKESGPARLPMVSQLVSLQPFASKNFPV